jgi:branched-chain amino acid transport system substrate-binding protein
MSSRKRLGVSSAVAAILLIIGLIIGAAGGYFVTASAPPVTTTITKPTTVTQTATATLTSTATVTQAPVTATVTSTVMSTTTATGAGARLSGEIPVGALMSLSGDLASFGKRESTALKIAEKEINDWLKQSGQAWTFKIIEEDTATQPALALQKLQSLAARGVKLVIGPLSSGELRNIKGYADSNRILVVSQSSTAPALAIPDDYVFRLVPDDNFQGKALSKLISSAGVEHVVVIYRGDAWGDGLQDAFSKEFSKAKGEVAQIRYNPDAKDFSAELSGANTKVGDWVKSYGASKVAVLDISFDEAALILLQAKDYPNLVGVAWYGTDGTAQNSRVISDAGDTAAKVKLYSTIFAATSSPKYDKLRSQVKAAIGEDPEIYSYTIYDIAWTLAIAIATTGVYDASAIKQIYPTVCANYFGASGWTLLNEAGDRAGGDYDIWGVVKTPQGTYDWAKVAIYNFASDSVTWM